MGFRDYSILATQAALKRMGQPHGGGPELSSTMACVVAQKLSALENKDKVHDLEALKNIHRIASYFFIEGEAYRTNKEHHKRNRSNETVEANDHHKRNFSYAFRRLVFTLGLVLLPLRLRWCWMPLIRKLLKKL